MSLTRMRVRPFVPLLALVLILGGCATLRNRGGTPPPSGFLGDYSQLKESKEWDAALVYVDPQTQWSRYDAIQLDSVTLWTNRGTADIGEKEAQMLTDIVYEALYEELGKVFRLSDSAGASTLRLRVALTQAKGANVPLRTMTTAIPQMRVLGTVASLGVDTTATVGSATIEVDMRDSITDQRVAAAVDQRVGTKVLLSTQSYKTWGDVEEAAEFWARRLAWGPARVGMTRKPGVPMPSKPSVDRAL